MSSEGTSVAYEKRGYSRGLILGLTMAETLLLLSFCLLIAAGAIVERERKARESVTANIDLREEKIRKLVLRQKAVDALAEAGVRTEDIARIAPAAAELEKLDLVDPREIDKLVEIRKILAKHDVRGEQMTPASLDAELTKPQGAAKAHDWPPIISMSDLDGYHFKTGSAVLSEGFKQKLGQKSTDIAALARKYDADVVEVIGHTDEQPVSRRSSNLDINLRNVLDGAEPVSALHPADNAGLGLARALAVTEYLKRFADMKGLTLLPMSAAQMVLPGDHVTDGNHPGDQKTRRRIEIRVRQRNRTTP